MNVCAAYRHLVIAYAALALCAAADGHAETAFQEFSATVVTTDKGKETTGRAFIAKDKVRTEYPDVVIITRLDKNRSWAFIPEEYVYIERPIARKLVTSASGASANEIQRESLGVEMVDGKRTEKYRVTYDDAVGNVVVFQWIADHISTPVKVSAEDGNWVVEYRDIRIGPVDAGLFEIPEGFVPAEKPAVMPALDEYVEWNDE